MRPRMHALQCKQHCCPLSTYAVLFVDHVGWECTTSTTTSTNNNTKLLQSGVHRLQAPHCEGIVSTAVRLVVGPGMHPAAVSIHRAATSSLLCSRCCGCEPSCSPKALLGCIQTVGFRPCLLALVLLQLKLRLQLKLLCCQHAVLLLLLLLWLCACTHACQHAM